MVLHEESANPCRDQLKYQRTPNNATERLLFMVEHPLNYRNQYTATQEHPVHTRESIS
jgi:hypothetical protein